MPLNTITFAGLETKLVSAARIMSKVELFFVGQPVDSVRIIDASITTAKIADLSVTNAKFDTLAITNAKITSVDAAKFTAGTLSASRIAAGSITAEKIDVTTLAAISSDVGTMTAGALNGLTVTGGTLRTASSGNRVEITASPNALIIYNGSDERVRFDPDGLKVTNLGIWLLNSSGDFRGGIFREASSNFILQGENCDELVIANVKSGGDVQIVAADGTIYLQSGHTIKINGTTKTAIVPTSDGFKSLYCLESPEVWLFDFAKSSEDIDPLFLEVTEGETNALKTDQGELLLFRRRKGFGNVRFESKTVEQFNRNNHFWGSV